jgi:hypothetical protein
MSYISQQTAKRKRNMKNFTLMISMLTMVLSFSVFADDAVSDTADTVGNAASATVDTAGDVTNTAVDTTGDVVNNTVDTTGNVVNNATSDNQ